MPRQPAQPQAEVGQQRRSNPQIEFVLRGQRRLGAARGHINLYVTNVPGPPVPLYPAGAYLLDAVPLAPPVANVRLSVTALSYDGVLSIALLAGQAITNLPAMAAGMQSALHPTGPRHPDASRSLRAG